MSAAQREAAFALLRASLSAKGLKLTRDIMKLNDTLGELNDNDFEQYGEWRYHITVMGSRRPPSRGAGSSTAITPSSTTSCWATRW